MNRLVNLLFALILIIALVIALDPASRQRAGVWLQRMEPTLQKWDERIIVNIPSIRVSNQSLTPGPTQTPIPTPLVNNDDDEIIPNTGDDSSNEPVIQINWDALGDALRDFWESIRNIKIDLNPNDNK